MKYKIGDKVVPFRKTQGGGQSKFPNYGTYEQAQRLNQPYLYVVGIDSIGVYKLSSYKKEVMFGWDYYHESDLRCYLTKYKLKALLKD